MAICVVPKQAQSLFLIAFLKCSNHNYQLKQVPKILNIPSISMEGTLKEMPAFRSKPSRAYHPQLAFEQPPFHLHTQYVVFQKQQDRE